MTGTKETRTGRGSSRYGSAGINTSFAPVPRTAGRSIREGLKIAGGGAATLVAAVALGLNGVAHAQVVETSPNSCDVYPLGDPLVDGVNVQTAVDDYTHVTLKPIAEGTTNPTQFDFGIVTVAITQPGVVLAGEGRSGDRPAAQITSVMTPLEVRAGAVTVRNLHFRPTGPLANGPSAMDCFSDHPVSIVGNYLEFQYADKPMLLNRIGIVAQRFDCPLIIERNTVYAVPTDHPFEAGFHPMNGWFFAGIEVGAYNPNSNQENEHSVFITDNTVEIIGALGAPHYAMRIGNNVLGLNNVLVEGNTIKGTSSTGISVWPYGRNAIINDNDLSGLTTNYVQLWMMAARTICTNNVVGPVVPLYNVLATDWSTGGLVVCNRNWHTPGMPHGYEDMPYQGNRAEDGFYARNDFRLTGLPGWSFDDEGNTVTYGCIALYSYNQLFETAPPVFSTSGLGCENNVVFQVNKFPGGNSKQEMRRQILDLGENNQIIGLH
jgi:hypothetical protein